ncbi:DUF3606 domain-containing protein [Polluticoccus soli]|uniref:DUF3606 domain-containing protein n=1 Tax=Polluticoccus soli TaxID=3034150 RepID=UPI0023E1C832|nr:DUF3606 domain-containing protein [Flavipsychrobacter sp. JY13-12]
MASNNPNDNRGNLGNDRSRGGESQKLDVSLLAKKFNCSEDEVQRAIQQVGNDRTKLEEYLRNKRR